MTSLKQRARKQSPETWYLHRAAGVVEYAAVPDPQKLSLLGQRNKKAQRKAYSVIDEVVNNQEITELILTLGGHEVAHPMLGVCFRWAKCARASNLLYRRQDWNAFMDMTMRTFWDKIVVPFRITTVAEADKWRKDAVYMCRKHVFNQLIAHITPDVADELNLPKAHHRVKKFYDGTISEVDVQYMTEQSFLKTLEHTNGMWGVLQRRAHKVRGLNLAHAKPVVVWHPEQARHRELISKAIKDARWDGCLPEDALKEMMRSYKLTKPIWTDLIRH